MRIPKSYGNYRTDKCPFCGRQASITSDEDVPVCVSHKHATLPELKCVCGKPVMMMKGKFGIFFNCLHCGNMNAKRIFEMNVITDTKKEKNIDDENDDDNQGYKIKRYSAGEESTMRSDEIE
jgi:hypothetical protein